jgi:hypothetical protein
MVTIAFALFTSVSLMVSILVVCLTSPKPRDRSLVFFVYQLNHVPYFI